MADGLDYQREPLSLDLLPETLHPIKRSGLLGAIKQYLLSQNVVFEKMKSTGLKPNGIFGAFEKNHLFVENKRRESKPECSCEDGKHVRSLKDLANMLHNKIKSDQDHSKDKNISEEQKRFQPTEINDFWATRGKKAN